MAAFTVTLVAYINDITGEDENYTSRSFNQRTWVASLYFEFWVIVCATTYSLGLGGAFGEGLRGVLQIEDRIKNALFVLGTVAQLGALAIAILTAKFYLDTQAVTATDRGLLLLTVCLPNCLYVLALFVPFYMFSIVLAPVTRILNLFTPRRQPSVSHG